MILHVDQKHVLSATGNLYVDFVNISKYAILKRNRIILKDTVLFMSKIIVLAWRNTFKIISCHFTFLPTLLCIMTYFLLYFRNPDSIWKVCGPFVKKYITRLFYFLFRFLHYICQIYWTIDIYTFTHYLKFEGLKLFFNLFL